MFRHIDEMQPSCSLDQTEQLILNLLADFWSYVLQKNKQSCFWSQDESYCTFCYFLTPDEQNLQHVPICLSTVFWLTARP